jgi:subtilisin family serine protease
VSRLRLLSLLLCVVALALLPDGSALLAQSGDPDVAPGRVIVKLKGGRAAQSLSVEASAPEVESVHARRRPDKQLWRVRPGRERDVARRLAARADVEYAEPDRIVRTQLVPNDPLYASHQWNLARVNAEPAWDISTGRPDVVVAVIDTGFDVSHPDRPVNLRLGCDHVRWGLAKDQPCPTVAYDHHGHGTHVAGIVAAAQNNGQHVAGVAPNVTVLAIAAFGADGSGYGSDVADAIEEAVDAGARVVNLSAGTASPGRREREAVEYALERGVVVVAAAGNGGVSNGTAATYPAAWPGVVAVGATGPWDQRAYYSNTGTYVSLAAPGGSGGSDPAYGITSLWPVSRGGHAVLSGTSMATPHVAAAAALLRSIRSDLTGADVGNLLRSTARRVVGAPDTNHGHGILDLRAALEAARTAVSPVPPTSPIAQPTPWPTYTPWPTPPATPTPPRNDRRADATDVTLPFVDTPDTRHATLERDELVQCSSGGTVWYRLIVDAPTWVSADTGGSEVETAVNVYRETDQNGLEYLTCGFSSNRRLLLEFVAMPNAAYWLQVGASGWYSVGQLRLAVTGASMSATPTPSARPAEAAVAYRVGPEQSGSAISRSLAPPLVRRWTVDVAEGSAFSYPLIADGKVFVTHAPAWSGSPTIPQLLALDARSGGTLWGPIALDGSRYGRATMAYDAGRLFVAEDSGSLRAFDGASGTELWSQPAPPFTYAFMPPVARDGSVYLVVGGYASAFDGATGQQRWRAPATPGSPAVLGDALYVGDVCGNALRLRAVDGLTLCG